VKYQYHVKPEENDVNGNTRLASFVGAKILARGSFVFCFLSPLVHQHVNADSDPATVTSLLGQRHHEVLIRRKHGRTTSSYLKGLMRSGGFFRITLLETCPPSTVSPGIPSSRVARLSHLHDYNYASHSHSLYFSRVSLRSATSLNFPHWFPTSDS
jgi:hypothetical protein